jgi:hypothetical protein
LLIAGHPRTNPDKAKPAQSRDRAGRSAISVHP